MNKEKQIGGTHYQAGVVQPVEIAERLGLGFCAGSTLKYLFRFRKKNGLEDLKKALHYCELAVKYAPNTRLPANDDLYYMYETMLCRWPEDVRHIAERILAAEKCSLSFLEVCWADVANGIRKLIAEEYPDED